MDLGTAAAGLILFGLTLYVLMGGADFGGGVWEFNLALRAPKKERDLIYSAIGPVWEANHVWLIFAMVLLFQAFPVAFAALSRALFVPLLLALVGIVLRGVGFAYRSYSVGAVRQQELWDTVFALASTAAPFFLGASAGAIASGSLEISADGRFEGRYLTGWISPLSIFSAFFAVGLCAYLSSVYLTREAMLRGDQDLVRVWRRRALATGIWMGVLAMTGIAVMATSAPLLWEGFRARAFPVVGISILAGLFSLWALSARRFTAAAIGAAGTAATVVIGWGLAQYPALVPPSITIESARGPDQVIAAMLWAVGIGAVVLVPSLAYLIYVFKVKRWEVRPRE